MTNSLWATGAAALGAGLFLLAGCPASAIEPTGQRPPEIQVAGHGHGHDNDWDDDDLRLSVRDSEEIRRTFAAARTSRPFQVEVENIDGSIEVTAHDAAEVRLVAHRTNRARSAEKLQEAKQQVRLDMLEETGLLHIEVVSPERPKKSSRHNNDASHVGYAVHVDFELQVPRESIVILRTVNDGDIRVTGVRGGYEVENINGDITMAEMGGSGRVYALNGEVRVSFEDNPADKSYFGSLNGDIEVAFRDGLSADLTLKTRNGEAYTDFETTSVSGQQVQHERRGGKNVYRIDSGFKTRVGHGGPGFEFDAFNGDIRVVNRDR